MIIATGSGTQFALFVAPVLVFASYLAGMPMSLVFNPFEYVNLSRIARECTPMPARELPGARVG